MADKSEVVPSKSASNGAAAVVAPVAPTTPPTPATPPVPRRGPGHRGADARDTVAEMAARAQEISQEAGSKIAGAMKEVIGAAAGISTFAIESARDVVQFMVRRGAMAQAEAEKLMREVEDAHGKRKPTAPATDAKKPAARPAAAPAAHAHAPAHVPAAKAKPTKAARPAPAAKSAVHSAPKGKSPVRHAAPKAAKPARPAAKKKKKK